jgi:hypothetical protein
VTVEGVLELFFIKKGHDDNGIRIIKIDEYHLLKTFSCPTDATTNQYYDDIQWCIAKSWLFG